MFDDIQFARFAGRPMRHLPADARMLAGRWRRWREHPCAPLVESLLDERGLDELDVLIVESGPSLAVETALDVQFLAANDDPAELTAELAALVADLDHTVAWRVRDRMIQAALEACGLSDWVLEPSDTVGLHPPISRIDWATPLWAITASAPLLRHLERHGLEGRGIVDALHAGLAALPAQRGQPFAEVAGVLLTLDGGRLNCTCHGNGVGIMHDRDGLDLLLPEQHLSAAIMAAAAGRRLSEVAELSSPPPLIRGTDPVIQRMDDNDDDCSDLDPCTRIRLEAHTETLADIPQVALDAVRLTGPVARSVKPWLAPGLRADGARRVGAPAKCGTDLGAHRTEGAAP